MGENERVREGPREKEREITGGRCLEKGGEERMMPQPA